MAEISVHLFSKPENEVDLEKAKPEDFRKLGEEMQKRLSMVGEIVEKLEATGWERSAGVYGLNFFKTVKLKEAKEELKNLGIDENEVDIVEEDDEW